MITGRLHIRKRKVWVYRSDIGACNLVYALKIDMKPELNGQLYPAGGQMKPIYCSNPVG